MQDIVYGNRFGYDCQIGFHEHELTIKQRLEIDFEAHTDWRRAARQDSPEGIVDYSIAYEDIGALIEGRSWKLIEAVAESVAELLCDRFPVEKVRVRVTKRPITMHQIESVAVECWRSPSDFT